MNRRLPILACLLAAVMAVPLAWAAAPRSPEGVKNALRILAYVQDDMARKLPTKGYARLPHEDQEFQEAAVAMRDAVAMEAPEFRARVEAALGKALAASRNVAETSKSNDGERIGSAVAAVAAALQELNALFPESLRPVPGQLGTGPGGPPPGLR
jgi:hypothetical protein